MTTEHEPSHAKHASEAGTSRSRGVWLFLRDTVIIVLCAVLISVTIKTFLVRSFYIPTGSMKDTLQVDDRILVNQLVPDLMELSRGDVVVFRDPGGWLSGSPAPLATTTSAPRPSGCCPSGVAVVLSTRRRAPAGPT